VPFVASSGQKLFLLWPFKVTSSGLYSLCEKSKVNAAVFTNNMLQEIHHLTLANFCCNGIRLNKFLSMQGIQRSTSALK